MRNDYHSAATQIIDMLMLKNPTVRNQFYASILETLKFAIEQQFQTEGAYFGKKWDELEDTTKEERGKQGYNPAHPILQRSGMLKNTADGIVAGDSLYLNNPMDYASFLQFGTKYMPARPFFPNDASELPADILTEIQDDYVRIITNNLK